MSTNVNLKTLSERLGLSQTTVSRALNGYPEVSEKTRRRVTEAACMHGYRPNVNARRLATGRVGAVGVFLPALGTVEVGPHTSEFLSGLATRLARAEIDILVMPLESGDETAAYRRLVTSKRVDAVVVRSAGIRDERIDTLSDVGLPFVLHGRTDAKTPHAWLDIDNEGALFAATSHLLELGHRRIGIINGPRGMSFSECREKGYARALDQRGIRTDPTLVFNGLFTDETGSLATRDFLGLANPPTAILAGSMMTALGAMRAVRAAGLELGKDVSLIAHDDVFPYLDPDKMAPSLSTTQSSIRDAGDRIGEMVIQLLNGAPIEDLQEVWPVELVLRESTRPPR